MTKYRESRKRLRWNDDDRLALAKELAYMAIEEPDRPVGAREVWNYVVANYPACAQAVFGRRLDWLKDVVGAVRAETGATITARKLHRAGYKSLYGGRPTWLHDRVENWVHPDAAMLANPA